MSVRIAEAGEDGATLEVDQLCVAAEPYGRRRSDGRDAPRLDKERLRHPHGGMDAPVDQRRLFCMGHQNPASLNFVIFPSPVGEPL